MPDERESIANNRVRLVDAGNGAAWCRIPDGVLGQLGWKEGDRVEVIATTAGIVVRKEGDADDE